MEQEDIEVSACSWGLMMKSDLVDYPSFLGDIKARIRQAQANSVLSVLDILCQSSVEGGGDDADGC